MSDLDQSAGSVNSSVVVEAPELTIGGGTDFVSSLMSMGKDSASSIYGGISSRAIRAKENIRPKIAAANEKFVAKACQLWSKLHSEPVQVSFQELQNQLLALYNDILAGSADEIKRSITDSRGESIMLRVRKVSEVAILVSTKRLHALIDFAEQKINILLPEQVGEENTNEILKSTEAVIEKHIPNAVSRRVIILPLTISYRICKAINMKSDVYVSLILSSSRSRLDQLMTRFSDVGANWGEVRHQIEDAAEHIVRVRSQVFQSLTESTELIKKNVEERNLLVRRFAENLYANYLRTLLEWKNLMQERVRDVRTRTYEKTVAVRKNTQEKLLKSFSHQWKNLSGHLNSVSMLVPDFVHKSIPVYIKDTATNAIEKVNKFAQLDSERMEGRERLEEIISRD